jgi:hypothetical protein
MINLKEISIGYLTFAKSKDLLCMQGSNGIDCKMYSSQMIKLAGIDAEHKRLIINNHGAFNGSSTNSEGGRSYWWILWVAIMLLRFASSSSCH